MTVASNTPYDQYTATGGQTVFNYSFEIVEQTDLLVYQTPAGDDPDDVTQLLTLTVDYTVTGVGNENGGTIVLVSGATLNDIVTIKQNVPVARDTAFTPGGVLRADDLNLEFDNQTLIGQVSRFNEESRMLRYWDSAIVTPIVDNIIPVLGANQIWAMNSNADEIITYDVPASGSLAPGDATYLLQTANSDLPNAQAMGALESGIVVNTATTGVQLTRVLTGTANQITLTNGNGIAGNPVVSITPNPTIPGTQYILLPSGTTAQRPVSPSDGMVRYNTTTQSLEVYEGSSWDSLAGGIVDSVVGTANQIDVDNTDPQNPVLTLSATIDAPGTFTIQGTVALDGIIDDDTFASATDTNIPTSESVKAYVDTTLGGYVLGVSGTANQIDVDNTDPQNPIVELSATVDLPGTFNIQASTAVDEIINDNTMATATATNLATALSIKTYIDSVAAGFTLINPVRVASTANLVATYSNGTSGVGATLTVTALGVASIDGVALSLNDRVLFKDQSTTFQNGIYYVSDVGSGGTSAVYTRTTDFDQPSEIDPGDLVPVIAGSTLAGTLWLQTATVTAVGTDPITFIQFAAAYTNVVTLTGTQTITGDKTFSGTTTLDNFIFDTNQMQHVSDTNNYFEFGTDTQNFVTGGSSRMDISNSGVRFGGANSRITTTLDEDNMASNSATALATQQSIKAYVDATAAKVDPTIQKFTSGSGTYTTPTSPAPLYIRVVAVGGGGGGAGGSGAGQGLGTAGGNTTFGTTLIVANGGSNSAGAGGTASLGAAIGIAIPGGIGGTAVQVVNCSGGNGAPSAFGGGGYGGGAANAGTAGATNSGAGGGGGGASAAAASGGGGSAGGYVDGIIASPAASYAYAVGAAGSGGAAGAAAGAGAAGGAGQIIVYEYYQ